MVNQVALEAAMANMTVPDTNIVRQAEEHIKTELKSPDAIVALTSLLRGSGNPGVRQLSAVLLRVKLGAHWIRLNDDTKEQVKAALLDVLASESEWLVTQNTVHVVAQLSKHQLQPGMGPGWDALNQFLLRCTTAAEPRARQLGMFMFYYLTESIGDYLAGSFASLCGVFSNALEDTEPAVRVAALKAAGALVAYLSEGEDVLQFRGLVPKMLQVLKQCVTDGQEDVAVQVIEVFGELADSDFPVINNCVPDCVQTLVLIAVESQLETGTRDAAVMTLAGLLQSKSKQITKAGLVSLLVSTCLKLFADDGGSLDQLSQAPVDDDAIAGMDCEETNKDWDDDMRDHRSAMRRMGATLVNTLTKSLPTRYVFEPLVKECIQYTNSENASMRRSGLLGIAYSCEGLYEQFVDQSTLENLVKLVVGKASDQVPAVRSAACTAMLYFSDTLLPEITEYHGIMLPVLFQLLDDPTRLVQSNTCLVLDEYVMHLDGKVLAPLLGHIVPRLLRLADPTQSHPSVTMQSLAIAVLSSLMMAAPIEYLPFMQSTIPVLAGLMVVTEEARFIVRGRATEAMGHVALAIFNENAPVEQHDMFLPILTDTVHHAIQSLQFEDPQLAEFSYGLFSNLALALGERIDPFAKEVIPILLNACKQDDEIKREVVDRDGVLLPEAFNKFDDPETAAARRNLAQGDPDELEDFIDEEEDDDDNFELMTPGVKVTMNIRTALVEAKTAACTALGRICENASPSVVGEHLEQILVTAVGQLAHHQHAEVRSAAVDLMSDVTLAVCRAEPLPDLNPVQQDAVRAHYLVSHRVFDADKKWLPGMPPAVATGKNLTTVLNDAVMPTLLRIIEEDMEKQVVTSCCTAIESIVSHVGPAAVVAHFEKLMSNVVKLFRAKSRCQRYDNEDSDDEQDEDSNDYHDPLTDAFLEMTGAVSLAIGGDALAPYAPKLFKAMLKYCKPSRAFTDRCVGLAALSELVISLGPSHLENMPVIFEKAFPVAIRRIADKEVLVRSNAAFLIGNLIEAGKQLLLGQVLSQAGLGIEVVTQQALVGLQPLLEQRSRCNEMATASVLANTVCSVEVTDMHRAIDNACGALARMLLSLGSQLGAYLPKIIPVLIDVLPLRLDADESFAVFHCLFELVKAGEPTTLSKLPDLIKVIALAASPQGRPGVLDTAALEGEGKEYAKLTLQHIVQNHRDVFDSVSSTLDATARSDMEVLFG